MRKKLFLALLLCLTVVVQAQSIWHEEVKRRLDVLMEDKLLETAQLGMMFWDLTDDTLFYQCHPRYLMRTASTMKALTAIAALDCLGVDYQLSTSLYYKGNIQNGVLSGDIICVGGMDPLFDETDMNVFISSLTQKGIKTLKGNIICDNSMRDDEKWGEGWCWDDKNPTLTPLLYGGKPGFGDQLMKGLRKAKVSVGGVRIVSGTLPEDARMLCLRTHSINQLLDQMMKESDNLYAECLYYQIAAHEAGRKAKAKHAQAYEKTLFSKIGLNADDYRLADGSGLSLYNYLSPACETMLMRYAWQQRDIFNHLLPSLPIAGVDGTLKKRMIGTSAEGNVKAKTGSVTGVSTLTGYLIASNGHLFCFSIMTQGLRRTAEGRLFQDRVLVALTTPLGEDMQAIWSLLEEQGK